MKKIMNVIGRFCKSVAAIAFTFGAGLLATAFIVWVGVPIGIFDSEIREIVWRGMLCPMWKLIWLIIKMAVLHTEKSYDDLIGFLNNATEKLQSFIDAE